MDEWFVMEHGSGGGKQVVAGPYSGGALAPLSLI